MLLWITWWLISKNKLWRKTVITLGEPPKYINTANISKNAMHLYVLKNKAQTLVNAMSYPVQHNKSSWSLTNHRKSKRKLRFRQCGPVQNKDNLVDVFLSLFGIRLKILASCHMHSFPLFKTIKYSFFIPRISIVKLFYFFFRKTVLQTGPTSGQHITASSILTFKNIIFLTRNAL